MPTVDLTAVRWRRSSRSSSEGNNANCVEVASVGRVTAVRDSKAPHAHPLHFPSTSWRAFLTKLT